MTHSTLQGLFLHEIYPCLSLENNRSLSFCQVSLDGALWLNPHFSCCLNSVLVVKSQQEEHYITEKWHKYTSFEMCWRRLLRVPWTARRSNQSTLKKKKKISHEYSLEGLMLKLKLQLFAHLMGRTDSLEKTLMLGNIEGRKRRGSQDEMVGWHHQVDGHEFE